MEDPYRPLHVAPPQPRTVEVVYRDLCQFRAMDYRAVTHNMRAHMDRLERELRDLLSRSR